MPRVLYASLVASLALALAGGGGAAEARELTEEERCLALTMYWEAKGEGRDGMIAVGSVVLNRVQHAEFPDTVCDVVFQGGETPPCQFSWWCDGRSDTPREPGAWRLAQQLAKKMLKSPPKADPTRGALFFHAASVKPSWRREFTRTTRVGSHIFYRH